jgi:serine/threonine protein kinase
MELHCTRPSCPKPTNHFSDLDDPKVLKTVQQKYCTTCGMPLILVGRYLPERLLGKGGFGAAFLARDRYTPTRRRCVVKQFQPSGNLTPDQMQLAQGLFEREAVALEDLGHRHGQIPNLYAYFPLAVPGQGSGSSQEEYFYLVQEFIDGQDLEQELTQNGPLREKDVLDVFVAVLKVLTFVHDNGTIHRDIKPSNIMRHRNGTLYLLDFGAVKQVAQQGAAQGGGPGAGNKSTGIYSMGFAPPEQMSGGKVYPSTDLYALAVTCITLLTGKDASQLYDNYNNTWSWEKHTPTAVSGHFANVLNRLLQTAPNQRYESAAATLEALLKPIRQAPPPRSAPPSPTAAAPASSPRGSSPAPTSLQQVPQAAGTPASPPPASPPPASPPFSLLEFLGGAAFTGFEGGLLALGFTSLLGTTLIGHGAWLLLLGVLVVLQWRRVIERVDLLIIAAVTLGIAIFLVDVSFPLLIVLAGMAALGTLAIATLFRLIYRLLSAVL